MTVSPDTSKNIGTISHGTLRIQDLLRAFASEIERNDADKWRGIICEARYFADEIDKDVSRNVDDAWNLYDDMLILLQDYAPEDHYFGVHEGDDSDFGYWPVEEYDVRWLD
jgi:hypothetical protein